MSTRDRLDKACRDEAQLAMILHADATDYAAGDMLPDQFLNTAYRYGKARLERERLQAELFP